MRTERATGLEDSLVNSRLGFICLPSFFRVTFTSISPASPSLAPSAPSCGAIRPRNSLDTWVIPFRSKVLPSSKFESSGSFVRLEIRKILRSSLP